jgi:hypothetical protein
LYTCEKVLNDKDEQNHRYKECFCFEYPKTDFCDSCTWDFSHPKCCQKILDDYETNDKFEYCCTTYPFHVNCRRNLKRLKKKNKGNKSGKGKRTGKGK